MYVEPSQHNKKWVWIPHSTQSFVSGYIDSIKENIATIITENNETHKVPLHRVSKMNPSKFNMVEDLALLSYLNEPSVLCNLKQRYEHDMIYTYSGLFLLSINPYKELKKMYSKSAIEEYQNHYRTSKQTGSAVTLQPHIFAFANSAYNLMLVNKENQSILITGESGAGKTVNTKKVIRFLAHIAREKDCSDDEVDISEKILETNTILEAFGNAQTIKNDNSSRFGKFIKIEFLEGKITGAYIEKYLLEKSRVTHVNANERNYHIFYQIVKGITKHGNFTSNDKKYDDFLEEIKSEMLFNANIKYDDFKYLKGTNFNIPNVDDASDFYQLNKSMNILGFSKEEKIKIFKIISAILHLGNLEFKENNDQVSLLNNEVLTNVCSLLKIPREKFLMSLLSPVIQAGNEKFVNSRSVEQVYQIVEALSRMLYERMFEKIIDKINVVLSNDSYKLNDKCNFIGVLDIAGFEIYLKNDFEQLCINFTNEKLQQFFNNHMFILEQEIYKRENIDWNFIDFGLDLQPTIDIIEKNNPIGIFSYLDEECVMPKGTDLTFLAKLSEVTNKKSDNLRNSVDGKFTKENHNLTINNSGSMFESFQKKVPIEILKLKNGFIIDHYAGRVEYIVDQWLKKNKDPHFEYLSCLLRESEDQYVREIFTFNSTGKKGFFRTVVQKHKDSLNMLMTQLRKTSPFFVRCILPNTEKKSNKLDNQLVLNQLKCNGVMEGIRISRQGYPTRILFREFRNRYSILCDYSKEMIDNKEACLKILTAIEPEIRRNSSENQTFDMENTQSDNLRINNIYKVGITMIFFKQGVLAEIEDIRDRRLEYFVGKLQSYVSGRLVYKRLAQKSIRKEAIRVVQKNARLSIQFMKWGWWRLYLKVKPLLEMTKYENIINQKNEEITRYNAHVKNEINKNDELKAKLVNIEKSNRSLVEEIEGKINQINEREELLNALRIEISDIQDKLEQSNQDNVKNNEKLNQKIKIVEQMQQFSVGQQDELNTVKKDLENMKKVNDKLNEERLKLQEKVTSKEAEMKNVNIKNISERDGLLIEKEKKILQFEQKNKELEQKLREIENNFQVQIKDLKNKVEHEIHQNEQLSLKQKSILEEQEKTTFETNEIQAINKQLSKDLKNKNEAYEKLKREIEDMNFGNQNIEANNLKLENKLKRFNEENDELKEKMKQDAIRFADFINENRILKEEKETLMQELEDEKNRKIGLTQSEESLLARFKTMQEENKRLIDLANEKENNMVHLKNTVDSLTKENQSRLQSRLDDFFKQENKYKKTINDLRVKNLHHENELYEIKMNKEVGVDNKAYENEIQKRKRFENLLTEEENKNIQLKNTIASLQIERDDIDRKNKLNEERCSQYESNSDLIGSNVKEIERLKGIINQRISDHNKVFENMLQKYRKDNDALSLEKSDLTERNKRLNDSVVTLSKKLQSVEQKFSKDQNELEQKVEEYCREIGSINASYKAIYDENCELKNQIEEKENVIKKERRKNIDIENSISNIEQTLKDKIFACEKKILEQNNKINYQSGRNHTLENKLMNMTAEYSNPSGSYLCDHCSIEKCICDSKCVIKCTSDFAATKKIEDLKLTLENEKYNYTNLQNKYERLNKNYVEFSKEYETLAKKQNENNGLIISLQKKAQLAQEHILLKSEQLSESLRETDSKKSEIETCNIIIKKLNSKIDEYKGKVDYLCTKASENNQPDELKAEKNKNDSMQTSLLILEKDLLRSNDLNEKYRKKIYERDETIKTITNEINNWQVEFLELKKMCNMYSLKISHLERDLEEEKLINNTLRYNSIMKSD